jgi:hypothetical protein
MSDGQSAVASLTDLAYDVADEEPRCIEIIASPKSRRQGQQCGRDLPCQVHRPPADDEISAAVVAEWLEEEIERRQQRDAGGNLIGAGGGVDQLASELAASGHWTRESAARVMSAIRNGERRNIGLAVVDKMTAALDQANVWQERPGFVEAARREGAAAGVELVDGTPCTSCGWSIPDGRPDARVGDECSVCFATAHKGTRFGALRRDDLLELYRRYVVDGYTLTELSRAIWQLKGYRSPHSCASAIQQGWKRNGWPMRNRSMSKQLRGQRRSYLNKDRKLPERAARAMHKLHWDEYVSLNELGRRHGAELGMSPTVLANQLSYTFKKLRLPVHDRIEMTVRASTKHGLARRTRPKSGGKFGNGSKAPGYKRWLLNQRAGGETRNALCVDTTATGKPCTHRALNDSVYCQSHDPERRQQIADRCAAMRKRSPIHNPERIEPAAPLVELLAQYRLAGGTWRGLARDSDVPESWIPHVAHGKQTNVSRERARLIREAIALPASDEQQPIIVAADSHIDDLEHVTRSSMNEVSRPPVRLARLERSDLVAIDVDEPEPEHDDGRYPTEAAA